LQASQIKPKLGTAQPRFVLYVFTSKCIINSLKSEDFKTILSGRKSGLSSLYGITGSGTSFPNSGSGHTGTGKTLNPVLVIRNGINAFKIRCPAPFLQTHFRSYYICSVLLTCVQEVILSPFWCLTNLYATILKFNLLWRGVGHFASKHRGLCPQHCS
jgi:hypothetical protein